jgi:alanine dehydrogenase
MSEVAGRIASQIGDQFLVRIKGGKGILVSGVKSPNLSYDLDYDFNDLILAH